MKDVFKSPRSSNKFCLPHPPNIS